MSLKLPVVQAPIGTAATPALAAAVAEAGGLGMLALSWATPAQIRRQIQATRALTGRPFGVNLVLEWPQDERLLGVLAEGITVVSTFWGDPAPCVAPVHQAGGLLIHTVGSVAEARAAEAAGVDVLVAQGLEAGGHVRGTTPVLELVAAIRQACPGVPVLAAGAIATAADSLAARRAGAAGVWVGTRFVCTPEADAAPVYQQRILAAGPGDTVLTTAFHQGWPDAPHRVLRNATVAAFESGQGNGTSTVVAHSASGRPILRHAYALPTRSMTGDLEAMALYAGLGVERIREIRPAAGIVEELAAVWK